MVSKIAILAHVMYSTLAVMSSQGDDGKAAYESRYDWKCRFWYRSGDVS